MLRPLLNLLALLAVTSLAAPVAGQHAHSATPDIVPDQTERHRPAPDLDYDGDVRDDFHTPAEGDVTEEEARRMVRDQLDRLDRRIEEFAFEINTWISRVDPLDLEVDFLPIEALEEHSDELDDRVDDIRRDLHRIPQAPYADLASAMDDDVREIEWHVEMIAETTEGKRILVAFGAILRKLEQVRTLADRIDV